MKLRLTFYSIAFMLVMTEPAGAQQASDTITGKTVIYQVKKKTESVSGIAKKLKVDVAVISSLNNITSIDSILTRGQTIIVPASAIGRTNTKKQAARDVEQSTPENKEVVPPPGQALLPPVDTELIQNKILLTDATLDLNRTLLQGIQASLDSLNVKDKNVIDEKNISLTIHRMQRQRDKAMLTPVLLHMQDSLNTEIKKEEVEKSELENVLNGVATARVAQDTLITNSVIKDSALQKTNVTQPVASVMDSSAKDETRHVIDNIDTVAATATQQNENQTPPEPVHIKPVIEAEPSGPAPIMHWETAKAIYYNDDTTGGEQNTNELTAATTALNGGGDTTAYISGVSKEDAGKPQPKSDEARTVRAKYFYTRALKDITTRNYNGAVSYLKKSIDLSSRYYDAWLALGETDAHLGLYTKALNELRYCETIDSSSEVLFYKMGLVRLKLKQKSEAFADFNRSLKLNPDYLPAIIARATEYADRNQFKTAIREYNKALQLDPAYHTIYKQRGMAHYALKNYEAAIDDFSRFLIFHETDGSVYYHRGMARLKQQQMTDACEDFAVSAKLGYRAAAKALAKHCK